MRKKIRPEEDNRQVVIYARKSKITHKGDSISNQEEYCKDYARIHLNLPEDYEYGIYEDEGISGFYSDRPDFQRMIHDVEKKKIKAIVCYKLDRISRKMSDLTTMINFLNKYDVALLISSNNLNTKDSGSKMMIQMLGMIAEFERDILTERIQDNLGELAKDGRWMGGIAPTGFVIERSKYGTGKSRSSFSYLVPVPKERALVQHVFEIFISTRSYKETVLRLNKEGWKTRIGGSFRLSSVKDMIRNPVYCVADQDSYKYFLDTGCNLYGEKSEYDGVHGISVYNRTTQLKEESDDSTFLNPEFSRYTLFKEEDEWIIAPGKHEGYIPSATWIEAQNIKDEIFERYNRPHRATNALLAGIMYCPICGSRLSIISESKRYTHGKPRFKYACPNAVRRGTCSFQAVHGVEMDEYIVKELSKLGKNKKNRYWAKLQSDIKARMDNKSSEADMKALSKELQKLELDIKTQVKALRDASEATKPYIQADIDEMAAEATEKRRALRKLEESAENEESQFRDYSRSLNTLEDFSAIIKGKTPDEIINAIKTVVARIYVVRSGDGGKVNVFLKGEDIDYERFFEQSDTAQKGALSCDPEQCRKLHPHIRGRGTEGRVRPADGTAAGALRRGI